MKMILIAIIALITIIALPFIWVSLTYSVGETMIPFLVVYGFIIAGYVQFIREEWF